MDRVTATVELWDTFLSFLGLPSSSHLAFFFPLTTSLLELFWDICIQVVLVPSPVPLDLSTQIAPAPRAVQAWVRQQHH